MSHKRYSIVTWEDVLRGLHLIDATDRMGKLRRTLSKRECVFECYFTSADSLQLYGNLVENRTNVI